MHARFAGAASLAFMLGTTWAASGHAHALFDTPDPRDQQDGYKDGTACGVIRASSQPVTNYLPGQELKVEWLETVNHNGCFLIELSAQGDQDFQILGRKSHSNPPAPAEPTSSDPRRWSLQVKLPNMSCDGCTLRVRQIMVSEDLAEAACTPASALEGSTYTTCANITLGSGGAGSTGGGAGTGGSAGTGGGSAAGADTGGGGSSGGGGGSAAGAGTGGGGSGSGGAASSALPHDEAGCSLAKAPRSSGSLLGSLLAVVALLRRRRAAKR